MGLLMIKCPNTGRVISTGRRTDQTSFERSAVFFGRTYCPFCRISHEWFAKEAWISERDRESHPKEVGLDTYAASAHRL